MPQITTIGVIGAGTMGHGIAHVAAQAGFTTILYDVSRDLADKGREKIAANLQKGVEKGKVKAEDREAALARISTTGALHDLKGCGLVIEAAPENLSLKQTIFGQLSDICAEDAILDTNTST